MDLSEALAMPKSTLDSVNPGFRFWDFPGEAAVREPPPALVADAERARLEALFQASTDPATDDGDEIFVILGLDFGTSSTKMIVRLPYEAGEPAIAIPAPVFCRSGQDRYTWKTVLWRGLARALAPIGWRQGEDPYFWKTVLWLRQDGKFSPWPEYGAMPLNSIKQGLIQGRSHTAISGSKIARTVSRAQVAVAYLSFVIRYVRGWLRDNRPDIFRRRKPVWFVNLGMPAASYDDPYLTHPYRRIGAAALQLAKSGSAITIQTTQRFLEDPHVVGAERSEKTAEEVGVAIVPETAAGMMGFTRSTRSAPGLYLMVDVGAMTLDACMFRLSYRRDPDGVGRDHYFLMTAEVRPLGVDALHWFLGEGRTETGFVEQCKRVLWYVVWHTKTKRDPRAECWRPGNDVPIFLTGGGAQNRLHQDIVESLDPWLKQFLPESGTRIVKLPMPTTMILPEPLRDLHRMTVAWGLSYPEIGRAHPMHSIADVLPPRHRDYDDSFVSKDHV